MFQLLVFMYNRCVGWVLACTLLATPTELSVVLMNVSVVGVCVQPVCGMGAGLYAAGHA